MHGPQTGRLTADDLTALTRPPDIAGLVQHDRAHRRIYTDPEIFVLEQQRIFGRVWLYVALESELREAGVSTPVGFQASMAE